MAGEPSSHISTLISLCFGETGQRHPCTWCTFLIFWQWGNPPIGALYLCVVTTFSYGRGVGDLGLHLLSRSVTQVTPFFREDERNPGREEEMGHCSTKAKGPRLGFQDSVGY